MLNLKISTGEVIVLTEGEYSDYGIDSYIVAIKSFDMAIEAQKFALKNGGNRYYDFCAYLIASELVIPVAHREIYLGAYSKFDEDFGIKEEE